MTKSGLANATAAPIAVVGLGCRFPDASNPDGLFDAVLAGRRAFRRVPPCRVDLADYYSAVPATSDATYSTRAALIEGWRFDAAAFGVPPSALLAGDPAQWLALETAASTLAAAGFPEGAGLPRDRTAVIIGNTLGGDVSRAAALRLRWPYVRQVVAEAVHAEGLPAGQADRVLRRAAARYLAPFPAVTGLTRTFTSPAGFATGIAAYFGFRGGSFAIDAGSASSLVAVANACAALAAGDIDAAIAGGVDVSLDPLELVGMAKAGVLATSDMRIYDEEPTGFLPGEGCGLVLLMRSADVAAAGCRPHAHILGWGTAEAGQLSQLSQLTADPDSHLLALRRAYRRAGADPADVALFEGAGTGIAAADEAELTALASLRAGTATPAAIGAATACIGHCRAAAGAAGLIKTVMAVRDGVVPPAAGVRTPHPIARQAAAGLRFPAGAEPWPDGIRLAGISAAGHDDLTVHLVLRDDSGTATVASGRKRGRPGKAVVKAGGSGRADGLRPGRQDRTRTLLRRSRAADETGDTRGPRLGAAAAGGPDHRIAYLMHAPDRAALTAVLARIADIAPWLSDAELGDLACQLAWDGASQGPVRVAIVASRQEQLARLAAEAITVLPRLADGLLAVRPGIFAADGADGRVTLLLPAGPGEMAGDSRKQPKADQAGALASILAALRWLDDLGVVSRAAVGEGLGWLAGLAWAGCLADKDVLDLLPARAAALRGKPADAQARLRAAADRMSLHPPGLRLISAATATELTSAREIVSMLGVGPSEPDSRANAIRLGAVGASLLVETGPGTDLAVQAAAVTGVPVVGLNTGQAADRDAARVVAALFAVGALARPETLFAGQHSRPIDIWREQVFISSPCQAEPVADAVAATELAPPPAGQPSDQPAESPTAAAVTQHALPAAGHAGDLPTELAPAAANPAGGEPVSLRAEPADTALATRAAQAPDMAQVAGAGAAGMADADAIAGQARRQADAPPARAAALTRQPTGRIPQCYMAELREPEAAPAPRNGPWRVHATGGDSVSIQVRSLFRNKQNARRTLVVLGNGSYREDLRVAVRAVSDAMATEHLVVISPGQELAGLWQCLHAEHPAVSITVIRVAATIGGLRAARTVAAVTQGTYRELDIGPDGKMRELTMVEVQAPGGGSFPLGDQDVILVSRDAGVAGLAFAQAVARFGAAAVIIGTGQGGHDEQFASALAQLTSAGVAVSHEPVDLADAVALAAAVDRIEQRLGPVTAVVHGTGTAPRVSVAELTEAAMLMHQRGAAGVLASLLGAVSPDRLKLLVTFGSAEARLGLAGQAPLALASAALADQGREMATALGCRTLHIDWPEWPGSRLEVRPRPDSSRDRDGAEHEDLARLAVGDGSRLLTRVLAMAELPARLVVLLRATAATTLHAEALTGAPPAAAVDAVPDTVGSAPETDAVPATATPMPATDAVPATATPMPAQDGMPAADATAAGATVAAAGSPATPTASAVAVAPVTAGPVVGGEADAAPGPDATDAGPQHAAALAAPEPAVMAAGPPVLPWRFCQHVLAHEPGSDLICETRLSAESDPYLADYRVDGLPIFPVSMALEAMAQAASVVAGGPVRAMTGISVLAPVVVPSGPAGGSTIRIRAQRDNGTVAVALRSELSGFAVDHLRAVFSTSPGPAPTAAAGLSTAGTPTAGQSTAGQPAGAMSRPGRLADVHRGHAGRGAVDATDMYGQVWFQAGRFRRITELAAITSRGCTAIALGADDQPWFGPGAGHAAGPVLGSPGVTDAMLQAVQACNPDRLMLPVSCESAVFGGLPAGGDVRISAAEVTTSSERAAAGTGTAGRQPAVPRQRDDLPASATARAAATPAEEAATSDADQSATVTAWDVTAEDTAGRQLACLRGVRFRDSGPLPVPGAWPAQLLAVYLERSARGLGLAADLEVSVRSRTELVPAQRRAGQPADEARAVAAADEVAGLRLQVASAGPAACGWQLVRAAGEAPADQELPALAGVLASADEPPRKIAARSAAIAACLLAGKASHADVTLTRAAGDGWIVLAAGQATVACVIAQVAEIADPVAIAVMTGDAGQGSPAGQSKRARSRARQRSAATKPA